MMAAVFGSGIVVKEVVVCKWWIRDFRRQTKHKLVNFFS